MSGTIGLDPKKSQNLETLAGNLPPPQSTHAAKVSSGSGVVIIPAQPFASPTLQPRHFSRFAEDAFADTTSPVQQNIWNNPSLQFNLAWVSWPAALAGLLSLASCSNDEKVANGSGTSDSGVSGTGGSGGSGGTGGSSGSSGTGDSGGTDGSIPGLPGDPTVLATAPCADGAFIPDLDEGVGICAKTAATPGLGTGGSDGGTVDANTRGTAGDGGTGEGGNIPAITDYQFFRWGTDGIEAGSTLPLGFQPDQILKTSSGEIFITTHADESPVNPQPAGLAIISGNSMEHIPFPKIVLGAPRPTSSGSEVSQIIPSMPKGLVEFNNKIFIALSGYDPVFQDYQPGAILIFDKVSKNFSYMMTSGFNPTSVALINSKLYVVNTGAMDDKGNPSTPSALQIFNPHTQEPLGDPVDLGSTLAGISGEIALTSDKKTMVLATGNNSGTLVVVDLTNLSKREIQVQTTSSTIFLTGLALSPNDEKVYVSNFNDGNLYTVDLASGTLAGPPLEVDPNLQDGRGFSDGILLGGYLYMGFGRDILKFPLN